MEELSPFAAQIHRQRELLGDGVGAGRLDHRPEARPQLFNRVAVGALAEDHVLVDRVLPRQLPQQVADVGADAVVAELAAVDGYAHRLTALP
jgi:hypothetical protein